MITRTVGCYVWRPAIVLAAAGAFALCLAPAPAQETERPVQVKSVVMPEGEFGVEWVDVAGRDPDEVAAAIEAMTAAFAEGYDTPQFFVIRSATRVAIHGTEHQREVVREVLGNLSPAPAPEQTTSVLRLQPQADLQLLEKIAAQPGMAECEVEGQFVMARGTSRQIATTQANLLAAGLISDETEPTCATVRLYYLRDADAVRSLLADVPDVLRGDAVVLASGDATGRQMLVLTGSPDNVRNLRRIIATLDVPQPEVRLDIWAFQISGANAEEVAARAACAQERINLVSGLIRGYLSQLEGLAQDQMAHNEELIEQLEPLITAVQEARKDAEHPEALTQAREALSQQVARMGLDSLGTDFLLTPSARGRHPLSLTETLAALLTTPSSAVVGADEVPPSLGDRMSVTMDLGSLLGAATGAAAGAADAQTSALERVLARRLERWLLQVMVTDPGAVRAWAEMVDEQAPGEECLCKMLTALRRCMDDRRQPRVVLTPRALVPRALLTAMADPTFARTAAGTITDFLALRGRLESDWSSVPADQLRMRGADAQTVLQTAERALADDVARLFLRPLERELRRIASKGGRAGLGSTSRTSISVLSGTEAQVVGSAISYFEVSRSPELTTDTLYRSEEFSRALSGMLPPRSQRDPVRRVIRIEL
ncbi:MAG TPA: hypothetical protein VM283_09500, partial [Armatimonadota bacterium]|nr:hypothetical protein [Armatimonadota bacterium]